MVDGIVVCLVMVGLFATSLIFMGVATQIIDKVFRAGKKDQLDYNPSNPPADFFEEGNL